MVNQIYFSPACMPTSCVCFLQTLQLAFPCQERRGEGTLQMASVHMHRGNVVKHTRAELSAPEQAAPSAVKYNAEGFTRLVTEGMAEPVPQLLQ